VAYSKAQAVREAGPYLLYFKTRRCSATATFRRRASSGRGYLSGRVVRYVRPENLTRRVGRPERFRDMTMADVEREAEHCRGARRRGYRAIIDAADHAGAAPCWWA